TTQPTPRATPFPYTTLFRSNADSWRMDPTVHPFASGTCPTDVRITTRYFPDRCESLFSMMHEFGHGLYEHQVSASLERMPLQRGASMSLHESQSRMWENLVGRSLPFWRRVYPELRSRFARLADVELEEFYRPVNTV